MTLVFADPDFCFHGGSKEQLCLPGLGGWVGPIPISEILLWELNMFDLRV